MKRPIVAFLLTSALGCQAITGGIDNAAVCQQSYEFGNYGCTRLIGQILGRDGLPVDRATALVVKSVDGSSNGIGAVADPDASGKFDIRITRYVPPIGRRFSDPDTVTMWIIAAIRPTVPEGRAPEADTIQRTLRFAPVGALPYVDTVTFLLDWPP